MDVPLPECQSRADQLILAYKPPRQANPPDPLLVVATNLGLDMVTTVPASPSCTPVATAATEARAASMTDVTTLAAIAPGAPPTLPMMTAKAITVLDLIRQLSTLIPGAAEALAPLTLAVPESTAPAPALAEPEDNKPTVQRTPAQAKAVAGAALLATQKALADHHARSLAKITSVQEEQQANLTEMQDRISDATSARDRLACHYETTNEQWRSVTQTKAQLLQEKIAEAQAHLTSAETAELAAGADLHKLPPPVTAADPASGTGGSSTVPKSDVAMDADNALDGDSSSTTMDDAGNDTHAASPPPPFVVSPFLHPPPIAELDEPTTALILAARFVLMHWHQQAETLPLTFNDLGLSPLQVRELIGSEAWTLAFASGDLPACSEPLPRVAIGALTAAVLAANTRASSASANHHEANSLKIMSTAAASAALKRTTAATAKTRNRKLGVAKGK